MYNTTIFVGEIQTRHYEKPLKPESDQTVTQTSQRGGPCCTSVHLDNALLNKLQLLFDR